MQEGGSGSAPGGTVVATVKWFDAIKGYGFLTPGDGSRDIFCHVSAVSRAGLLTLPEGASVACEVEQVRQGPQVRRIHAVDESTASSVPAAGGVPSGGGHGSASGGRVPSPGRRLVARVKWFVAAKGFGFLVPDDGSPDVFCHVSAVEEAGYGTLAQGAIVTCEVTEGRRGPAVSSILSVDASTATTDRAGPDGAGRDRRDGGWGHDRTGGAVEERCGTVKFYDAVKGYGFVVLDDGGRDVFVHGTVLGRAGLGPLEPGRQVSVMVAQGARGPEATHIELL